MQNQKKLNVCVIFSIVLWGVITLIRIMHHSPWYDEAHAWLIAQELNIVEIIREMKVEGHTFLWYLVLMPFAKSNFMYPYSMLLLNWLFCFIAILILWLKSPFNNWIKFLISFSFPFLVVYPVLARCYAIGIMLLFSITAMEKDKLNHPNWYALLLILCANTSVMAIVGATVFGLIFIYDLLKNKKKVLIPFTIMGLGALLVLFQLLGSDTKAHIEMPMNISFFSNLIISNIYINLILIAIIGLILTIFYVKNRVFPIFLVSSYLVLFLMNCIFMGTIWNHFFYYIYFIISCWVLKDNYKILKYDYVVSSLLIFISFLLIFYRAGNYFYSHIMTNNSKYSASIIKNDNNLRGANFILHNFEGYELYPYLKFLDIDFINYCSDEKFNYDSKTFYNSEYCNALNLQMKVDFYGDKFDKLLKDNKKNFVLEKENLNNIVLPVYGKNYNIVFKLYKKIKKDLFIYSVERKIIPYS